MMTYQETLSRLTVVEQKGTSAQCQCPAHDDKRASLTVTDAGDKVLLYCHAGCSFKSIMAAIKTGHADVVQSNPSVIETKPVKTLGRIVAEYPYHDENGQELFQCVRYEPKDFRQRYKANGQWIYNLQDVRRALFRLPQVIEAVGEGKQIFFVEGEKDVLNLEKIGITATTTPMGAGKNWDDTYSEALTGADVIILPDNDQAGKDHAQKVAKALQGNAKSVKIVELPGLQEKGDVSDWIESGGNSEKLLDLTDPAKLEQVNKPVLRCQSVNDVLRDAENQPIPKMLFSECWFEGEISFLFSDTNLGKSILAVQIAQAIASGEPIKGFKMEARPQPVVLVDFELSDKQFQNRYSDNYKDNFNFPDQFYRAKFDPDSFDIEGKIEDLVFQDIARILNEKKAEILIIDNLTWLRTETEKARDALPLMKQLKRIQKEQNLSILILGHSPKNSGITPISTNDLSGSKHLMNFCDSAFALGRSHLDSKLRYLKQVKIRSCDFVFDAGNVCVMRIDKIEPNFTGFEVVGYQPESKHLKPPKEVEDQITNQKIYEMHESGKSNREIAKELGTNHTKVARVLKSYVLPDASAPF